jgi:2'-5' RNA ligase
MKNRYFFVIYFYDEILRATLNALRLIADSRQRNLSHITVKGPYTTNQKKRLLMDSDEVKGTDLKVIGTGNFFEGTQNTVFLKCEDNEDLYNIWKSKEEKSFKEFHPHITIYDGNDRVYAQRIYDSLKSYRINFSFKVDKLEIYSSKDKDILFNLKNQVDYNFLTTISNVIITENNVDMLSQDERIRIISILGSFLQYRSRKNILASKISKQHYAEVTLEY